MGQPIEQRGSQSLGAALLDETGTDAAALACALGVSEPSARYILPDWPQRKNYVERKTGS
jgi:hypothetical protein